MADSRTVGNLSSNTQLNTEITSSSSSSASPLTHSHSSTLAPTPPASIPSEDVFSLIRFGQSMAVEVVNKFPAYATNSALRYFILAGFDLGLEMVETLLSARLNEPLSSASSASSLSSQSSLGFSQSARPSTMTAVNSLDQNIMQSIDHAFVQIGEIIKKKKKPQEAKEDNSNIEDPIKIFKSFLVQLAQDSQNKEKILSFLKQFTTRLKNPKVVPSVFFSKWGAQTFKEGNIEHPNGYETLFLTLFKACRKENIKHLVDFIFTISKVTFFSIHCEFAAKCLSESWARSFASGGAILHYYLSHSVTPPTLDEHVKMFLSKMSVTSSSSASSSISSNSFYHPSSRKRKASSDLKDARPRSSSSASSSIAKPKSISDKVDALLTLKNINPKDLGSHLEAFNHLLETLSTQHETSGKVDDFLNALRKRHANASLVIIKSCLKKKEIGKEAFISLFKRFNVDDFIKIYTHLPVSKPMLPECLKAYASSKSGMPNDNIDHFIRHANIYLSKHLTISSLSFFFDNYKKFLTGGRQEQRKPSWYIADASSDDENENEMASNDEENQSQSNNMADISEPDENSKEEPLTVSMNDCVSLPEFDDNEPDPAEMKRTNTSLLTSSSSMMFSPTPSTINSQIAGPSTTAASESHGDAFIAGLLGASI